MARNRGKKRRDPKFASGQQKRQGKSDNYSKWVIKRENPKYETYYKAQNIVPEEEWEQFMEAFRKDLPTTFRITGSKRNAQKLLDCFKKNYLSDLVTSETVTTTCTDEADTTTDEAAIIEKPKSLPWYPDEMCWQVNFSRTFIRKQPNLAKLKSFLVTESEIGNISRQEAVSMIPPLLLDIKPHHYVLDTCAAPGSKTVQLIEMLHSDDSSMPEGCVIANDSDNKRCYVMVHQTKRLGSPCCMVVNHDASIMPNIYLDTAKEGGGQRTTLKYDRILCDVPCSGDGTLRKNCDIWRQWSLNSGFSLHPLQLRILKRSIEMLKVGGRLVYSTCSLNPVEDEAVVAGLLTQCQGSVELIDVSDKLPGLKRSPGLSSWKIMIEKKGFFTRFEDVPKCTDSRKVRATMFPPADEGDLQRMGLNRCFRILPHQQDTGGFFVAVLKKVSRLPWASPSPSHPDGVTPGEQLDTTAENEARTSNSAGQPNAAEGNPDTVESGVRDDGGAATTHNQQTEEKDDGEVAAIAQTTEDMDGEVAAITQTTEDVDGEVAATANNQQAEASHQKSALQGGPPAKKARMQSFKEDPYVFFEENEPLWPEIRDFYGMEEGFDHKLLLTRCFFEKKKNIYLVNKVVKDVLENNKDSLKVVNTGIRTLSRSDSKGVNCNFRVTQEAVSVILPYISKRKVDIQMGDSIRLLTEENPFFHHLSDKSVLQLKQLDQGCVIFIQNGDGETPPSPPLILVGWKGKTSARSFVPKNDRQHILDMLGVSSNTYVHGDPSHGEGQDKEKERGEDESG